MIKTFGHHSGFTEEEIGSDFAKSLPIITHAFVCNVKAFNNDIKLSKMIQALRNVRIMDILQALFNLKVEYTPSVFAYSMLYPYTDNYLDSTEIFVQDNEYINRKFRLRLAGEEIESSNAYEKSLFDFVGIIEGQYPRASFEELYESLLYIHDAQCRSLDQHNSMISPYERDVLGISTEKGGASVPADAYLVNGNLSGAQADFAFAFGALEI